MAGGLEGKHILVVEDDYFIASDLKRALQREGAIVVGPVGSLDQGLVRIGTEVIDAAVLDVNLEGSFSYPIADRLTERAVPYLFLTGYDGWALPEQYRAVHRVAKPFAAATILAHVAAMVAEVQAA